MNSQSQREPEDMLAAGSVGSTAEWRRVKEFLAQSFTSYLGQEIDTIWEPEYEDISPRWGFSFGFRPRYRLGGPLGIEWYGVISHNSRGHTQALVLLFAQDERAIHFEGHECLFFEFMPGQGGLRRWVSRGWNVYEHEWEGYRRLSEVI